MKLGNAAKIRSGLVLSRKKAEHTDGVCYPLLTLRSINADGYIDRDELDPYFAAQILSPEYVTHAGDIIVRLTAPYTAVLIDETTEGIVVSSNFVVIQADRQQLLPEYLYWLLNTRKMKRRIYENATSNMLGAVKAKYFTDLVVRPISLADQQAVAQLNQLARREACLLDKLAQEKAKYYDAVIDQFQKDRKRSSEL